MAAQPVPAGFHTVTPYLIAKDAAKLISFLQAALGLEVKHIHKGPNGLIMHALLKLGDSMLMLSDAQGQWQSNISCIYLYVPDVDQLYQRAKNAGAETLNEPRTEFYGDRIAGIKDLHGNIWWIATHVEDVDEREIAARQQ